MPHSGPGSNVGVNNNVGVNFTYCGQYKNGTQFKVSGQRFGTKKEDGSYEKGGRPAEVFSKKGLGFLSVAPPEQEVR